MSLLAVSNVHADLGRRRVLDGISLDIGKGEFVGLIGPNGAGKTTLLRAILGLTPVSGTIALDGRENLKSRARAKLVSYVPQEREIVWPLTVERLVGLGRIPHLPALSTPGPRDLEAIKSAMRRMEVEAFASRAATDLSGGEKARVLIARALAQEAPLLLADEPTAGLDPAHQIALMRVFADIAREGNSVVVSLHDLGLAARWCTRLVLVVDGKVVADDVPRAVLTAERIREVYHVESYLAEHAGGPILMPYDVAGLSQ